MFDIERAGNSVRTYAVLLEQILEVQRVVVHLKGCPPSGGERLQRSQVWGIDGSGLLTGEGSDVVIVIKSCVFVGVGIFISSSIQWGRSSPVVGTSVYESGHKPLFSR